MTFFAFETLDNGPNIRHCPSCDKSSETLKRSSSCRKTAPPGPTRSMWGGERKRGENQYENDLI